MIVTAAAATAAAAADDDVLKGQPQSPSKDDHCAAGAECMRCWGGGGLQGVDEIQPA
jgi:hypothetical protein